MIRSRYFVVAHQNGAALVIGLIMLVLMTLMAISAFHLGTSQTQIVANAQYKNEGVAAAQIAIDTVLSSTNFTINPASAITNSNCGNGSTNILCVDSNGDGTNDVTVNITGPVDPSTGVRAVNPTCIAAAPIPVSALDLSKPNDLACSAGTQQTFGTAGSTSGNSLCANSTWEIDAQAVDSVTNTTVEVDQGVGVRIATTAMTQFCP